MKKTARKFLLVIFSLIFPSPGGKGVILMYHSICWDNLFFTVTPEVFEKQMKHVYHSNFKVVPLEEICLNVKRGESVRGKISITFDDGYKDFFSNALPILKKYNISATVFIITDKIGCKKFMTKEELILLSKEPLISLMPHTHTHPSLDVVPLQEALQEIEQSRIILEEITKKQANIFAYPKGRSTKDIENALKKTEKWIGAVSVRAGHVSSDDDRFTLKRVPVDSAVSSNLFKALLTGGLEVYEKIKNI